MSEKLKPCMHLQLLFRQMHVMSEDGKGESGYVYSCTACGTVALANFVNEAAAWNKRAGEK